jgi:hypothetical protein
MPSIFDPADPQIVTLRRWRVMEVQAHNGTRSRHVWGHDVTNDEGRASSSIVTFNAHTMTATTRSGTTYQLTGLPGNSRAGRHVWDQWRRASGVVSEFDVTDEYLDIEHAPREAFARINGLAAQGEEE